MTDRFSRLSLLATVAVTLAAFATAVLGQDVDGDLIPDSIENQVWYQDAGGSPTVQDVWVECDWMPGTVKQRNQLRARAQKVFQRAPVDGGIELHLTIDEAIPFEEQWGDVSTPDGHLVTLDKALDTRNAYFEGRPFSGGNATTMRPYMHYCAFVNAINAQGTSGYAFGIPGDLFVVALGQYKGLIPAKTLRRAEAGTFLHELGHNLGLTHGGANPRRHATHKPNYLSVMNYHHQFGFYRLTNANQAQPFKYWDYSRAGSDKALKEGSLSESEGILLGPEAEFADTPAMDRLLGLTFCPNGNAKAFLWNASLDFDCNAVIAAGPVSVDTNLDGKTNNLGKAKVDWERLRFNGVAAAGEPLGSPQAWAPIEELDRTLIYWMLRNERRLRRQRIVFPE